MKKLLLLSSVLFATSTFAQQDSTSFFKGRFLSLDLAGLNDFRILTQIDTAGRLISSNAQFHFVSAEVGYGWFYKNNKSLEFVLRTSVSYSESGPNNKDWTNGYGIGLKKTGFRHLYQNRLYLFLGQFYDLDYTNSRTFRPNGNVNNPTSEAYGFRFSLIPGLMYRVNNRVQLSVALNAFNVSVTRNKYNSPFLKPSTTFNYRIWSEMSAGNIQFKAIWLPKFLNKQL